MTPPSPPACYFDVTDVVRYAMGYTRVSGIQRVQLNLIAHMVRHHGGQQIRCTFEHPHRQAMFEFDAGALVEDPEFDADMLLRRLGLSGQSKVLPSKPRVRNYLRRYSDNKLKRTAVKTDIYLSAYFYPRRLATFGLRRPNAAELAAPPIELHAIDRPPADAAFVCLGANWSYPRVMAFGRQHAQHGGIVVQLVYDLIPRSHPEYVSANLTKDFNGWLDEIVQYTRRFACISKWTAAEFSRFVGVRDGIEIRPVALAHEFQGFERFAPVTLPGGDAVDAAAVPFVLCVGTLEVRKNGAALLRAWSRLAARLGDRLPRLVFAGKQGWRIHEFKSTLAADPELARRVRIVNSPSDRGLAYLYQRCLFAVFPSLDEGWGLPVGEAAWFGKFTISSNATSLPEVCGELVDYFDPTDLGALCACLERALTDPQYVRNKEQAIVHSPMRRWSDVANDIFAFISHTDQATAADARLLTS